MGVGWEGTGMVVGWEGEQSCDGRGSRAVMGGPSVNDVNQNVELDPPLHTPTQMTYFFVLLYDVTCISLPPVRIIPGSMQHKLPCASNTCIISTLCTGVCVCVCVLCVCVVCLCGEVLLSGFSHFRDLKPENILIDSHGYIKVTHCTPNKRMLFTHSFARLDGGLRFCKTCKRSYVDAVWNTRVPGT